MPTLILVDATGVLFRSYHAIQQMSSRKGEPTNALFGFCRTFLKLLKESKPDLLVSIFDGPHNERSRVELFKDYKSHRASTPSDLYPQMDAAIEFCKLIGVPYLSVEGVEADDTIATMTQWGLSQGMEVAIVSQDKDLCQLVSPQVSILNVVKDIKMGPKEVEEQFGIPPSLITDYLALVGDASDNVPGVAGIGPKSATELLKSFGSLESLLENIDQVKGEKKQELLKTGLENARLSKKLVMLDFEVPVSKDPEFYALKDQDTQGLKEFYGRYDFKQFAKELEVATPSEKSVFVCNIVQNDESFHSMLTDLKSSSLIAIRALGDSPHPIHSEPFALSLANHETAWYLPQVFLLSDVKKLQLIKESIAHATLIGHHFKETLHIFHRWGIDFQNKLFDTEIASYLIKAHLTSHSLENLRLDFLGKSTSLPSLIGKGTPYKKYSEVPYVMIAPIISEETFDLIPLHTKLAFEIQNMQLEPLMETLEMPLLRLLTSMEERGIYLDTAFLKILSDEIKTDLNRLQEEIFSHAGIQFNLNSPKQLGDILFDRLGLTSPKKEGRSTSADVLEFLETSHPIITPILQYRVLEKLRSTYIDALPEQVDPTTKRIHCTFNQANAATGRLSCQDPNLQNIPIRSAIGRKIRAAFRPQESGTVFLSADYSQIELRLLAHFAQDPLMIEAFQQSEDIHQATASKVFGVSLEEVTYEMRSKAKAVNYGILYGQQSFGLAQGLKISTKEASQFIEAYFKRYTHVKEYIEKCKRDAKTHGYSVTLLGRKRAIPELTHSNGMIRGFGERLAVNTPLQGSAADLIKAAMLKVEDVIHEHQLQAKMILQIHDELLFEIPETQVDACKPLIKKAMEEVWQLSVPLVVDVSVGKNWEEC